MYCNDLGYLGSSLGVGGFKVPTFAEHQLSTRNLKLQQEVAELKEKLEAMNKKLKLVARERDRLRFKLGIRLRNPNAKKEIMQHMENGLRNCEIAALGYCISTVKNTRKMLREIENGSSN